MSGPDNRWRERCEMYFSSMDKLTDNAKTTKKKKKSKKSRQKHSSNDDGEEAIGIPGQYQYGNKHRAITTFSDKKQPFKGLIRWLSSIDLHGTSMLPRSRSYSFCFLWTFLTILGCCLFALGSYVIIKDFVDDDQVIKLEKLDDNTNASPLSLALCNNNILRKSRITPGSRFFELYNLNSTLIQSSSANNIHQNSRKLGVSNLLENTSLLSFLQSHGLVETADPVLSDLNVEYSSFSAMQTDSDWGSIAASLKSLDANPFSRAFRLTSSELRELGHDMEESILSCTKNGRPCDSSEISYVQSLEHGNCAIVILSLQDSWFDSLTLVLDVQPEEYLSIASPAPGFHAAVQPLSSLSSTPVLSGNSPTAFPGKGLHLRVSKTHELKRKSKNCDDDDGDDSYKRQDCLSRCLQLHTANQCGCSISLQSPVSQRCHVNLQYEFVCQRLLQELHHRNQLPCDCPKTCLEEFITVSALPFDWIKDDSEDLLNAILEASGNPKNISNFRESVTSIKVSWNHVSYLRLEEEDKLSLFGMFIQLGSVSALTVGVSVLTVLELLWLLGKAVTHICFAVANRHESDDNTVHQLPPAPEVYPEFDNINHNWYAVRDHPGFPAAEPELRLAESPLNRRRRINNYIVPPEHQDYNDMHNPDNTEFIYRGRHKDSGFVYGDNPSDQNRPPIISDDDNTVEQQRKRRAENDLFHKPWDRTGQLGVYSRVVVPNLNLNDNTEVPLFNSPYLTLQEDFYPARNNPSDQDQDQDPDSSEAEANKVSFVTKSAQNSNKSKTGSGEQSKTESQQHADFYRPMSNTVVDGDGNDDEGKNKNKRIDDENIFKISDADLHDSSWLPDEEVAQAQGPDLRALERIFHSTTGQHYQHRPGHSRNVRVRGFGRVSKNNKPERYIHDTTPVRGSGNLQPTKLTSTPNTWHYFGNPAVNATAAYMMPSYDGRTAVFRPRGSYYMQSGGVGIVESSEGQVHYLH